MGLGHTGLHSGWHLHMRICRCVLSTFQIVCSLSSPGHLHLLLLSTNCVNASGLSLLTNVTAVVPTINLLCLRIFVATVTLMSGTPSSCGLAKHRSLVRYATLFTRQATVWPSKQVVALRDGTCDAYTLGYYSLFHIEIHSDL